ncbi:MAG: hypothetical protein WBE11_09750 [Candidatus Aminicenantaceae bacterium]
MKRVNFIVCIVFCLSLFAIQCSQDSNPVGPGASNETQSGDAVLLGNFVTSGTSSVDFGLIQVSVRGTNIQAQPDPNGDFQINSMPTGNQSVEVNVENCLSSIDIADVQSGEEIRMQLQIQENNCVMLQHMNRNKKSAETLQLEIRPKKWNIDWVNSTDEGHVRIYGTGFDTITSVVITGPTSSAHPTGIIIPNSGPEIGGTYCKAFFNQSDAIAAIPEPKRGDRHDITVVVTPDNEANPMTYPIVIVGAKSEPEDPDEPEVDLRMDINPQKWNTNWIKSNGYVTVRFRGEGFDRIDIGATEMSYGGTPIFPIRDSISGSCYSAKFSKNESIALFPVEDQQTGETYPVDVTVQIDGSPTPMPPYTIEIVGPNK